MPLKIGDIAPNFNLPDKDGTLHSLKALKTELKIIFFYPKDNTPGCTIEAIGFNQVLSKLKRKKISVFGISGGDIKTKTKFCEKNNLSLPLLSDTDFAVSKSYDSFGEKKFMGRKYLGIYRNTFVLDRKNRVIQVFESVDPKSHIEELMKYLSEKKKK